MRTPLIGMLAWVCIGCEAEVLLPTDGSAAEGGGEPSGGTVASASPEGGRRAAGCSPRWLHVLGGEGSNWVRSQAVGADGSVVVTVDNVGALTVDGVPVGLDQGGFALLKFDPSGALAWARRYGSSTQSPTLPVAIDPLGNIVVGGIGYGPQDLGAGVSSTVPYANGYVAAYSPQGDPLWIQAWGVPIESGGLVNLTLDRYGNIFVQGALGYDHDILELDGLTAVGSTFTAKLDPTGEALWVRAFDGELVERNGLATTPEGHAITGESLELAGNFGPYALSTNGDFDLMSLEIDIDGAILGARQFGDDSLQRARGIVIGPTGNRLLSSVTWGEIDFGSGPVGAVDSAEVTLVAFDASGAAMFVKTAPDTYEPQAISATEDGGFALATTSTLAAALGCTGLTTDGAVVTTFDATGVCQVEAQIARCVDSQDCRVEPAGVAVTRNRWVATGTFYGTLEIGGTTVTGAAWDSFVTTNVDCAAE